MFNNERCNDMSGMPMHETKMHEMHAHEMKSENMGAFCNTPMVMQPIMECPQEKICHREIVHEVPHIQPLNTRIVNHHVYRHTYTPSYSCCEENVCSDVYEQPCGRW